jgi:hypothetical protein
MKRILFFGLTIVLVASMMGLAHASMYWDRSEELDEEIPEQEVTPSPAPTPPAAQLPPPVQMYDDYEVPDIDSEEEEDVVEVAAPIPSSAVSPALPSTLSAPTTSPAPTVSPGERAIRPRGPAVTTAPRRDVDSQSPKPVTSTPGPPAQLRPGESTASKTTPAGDAPAMGEPPAAKKMPWGKVDVKPAEPTTSTFPRGEQKSQ